MIKLNTNQSIPKKFASVVKAIDANSNASGVILRSIFKYGVVNVDQANVVDGDFTVINNNFQDGNFELYVKYVGSNDLLVAYENPTEYSSDMGTLTADQIEAYYYGLDEVNLVSGDINNPFKIPLNIFYADTVSGFSTPYFSVMYLNGTPQESTNFDTISKTSPTSSTYNVPFTQVRAGVVYPEPIDTANAFNPVPIDGDSLDVWQTSFTYTDPESAEDFFAVYFSNFQVASTPRLLIAEVYNTSNGQTSYYPIPQDIADTTTGLYYRVDEEQLNKIYIPSAYFISTLGANNTTTLQTLILKLYFTTPLEELNPTSGGATFSNRKYQIPTTNLNPIDTNFKVFSHNTSNGQLVELSALSATLTGNAYEINYEEATIEIFNIIPGLVGQTINIYVADYYYTPPVVLDYGFDLANTIAAYGIKGALYLDDNPPSTNIADQPTNLYLYTYIDNKYSDYTTYIDSNSKLRTLPQVTEPESRFIITTGSNWGGTTLNGLSTYNVVQVGPLTLGATNYSFAVSPTFTQGFQNLVTVAQNLGSIGTNYNAMKYHESATITPPNDTEYFTLAYVPPEALFVQLYGYMTELSAYYGATTMPYSAQIIMRDLTTTTDTVLYEITPNSGLTTYFENVPTTYQTTPFINASVPATTGRKKLLLKVTLQGTLSSPNYTIDADMDLFINFG